MDFNNIKVISWDLDGTLYPLAEMKKHFVLICLKELITFQLDSFNELYKLYNYHRQLRQYRSGRRVRLTSQQIQEFSYLSAKWYGPAIKRAGKFQDIERVIKLFSTKKQVIVSDYRSDGKIEHLFSEYFWQKSYSGIDVGYLKPSPKIFNQVIKDFNIKPDELLHVGDKLHFDGEAAKQVGCNYLILGKDFQDYNTLFEQLENKCTI